MPEYKDIELRSEEVQEILTSIPNWMIRWGIIVVSGVILMVFLCMWFIKYPDIISTNIIITTNTPPEKLVAKIPGKIEVILVKEGTSVTKNTSLAVIENSANYKDVFRLSLELSKGVKTIETFNFEKFKEKQLGDIESAFAIFQKECIANELNTNLQPHQVESESQSYEAIQLKERLDLLESQKSITQSELALQKIDLDRFISLFNKGIIASQELEKHKLNYFQIDKNYKNLLSTISQLRSSLNELSRSRKVNQINEKTANINLKRNVIQSFYQLKKAIKDWELNYVLSSSINGKVSFLQLWSENQTVYAGDNLFAIIPTNAGGYIGKLKAPAQNSGKIKIGQNVNIRLANYPDLEFGIIKGAIKSISLTPDRDGNLLINVSLPKGLKTSYKKQIVFQQEMTGTADIVTQDMRLIERLLYHLRDVLKR